MRPLHPEKEFPGAAALFFGCMTDMVLHMIDIIALNVYNYARCFFSGSVMGI